jgi:hypothetical protein
VLCSPSVSFNQNPRYWSKFVFHVCACEGVQWISEIRGATKKPLFPGSGIFAWGVAQWSSNLPRVPLESSPSKEKLATYIFCLYIFAFMLILIINIPVLRKTPLPLKIVLATKSIIASLWYYSWRQWGAQWILGLLL